MKVSLSVLTAAALLAVSPWVAAQNLAIVNGKAVPTARVAQLEAQIAASGRPVDDAMRAQIKEEVIMREVFMQEAQKRGIAATKEYKDQMEVARQTILIRALFADYQKKSPVTDAEIQAEYDKFTAANGGKEYSARHILVENEADARKILEDLKKGKAFTAIAKEVSKDTGSKDKGGELGWAPAEAYVKEFSEALTKLTPGQVTANPVKTQFGWHIIQLVDARTQQGPSFDELKPQLAQRIQGAQLDAYLSKLKQQAKVE